MIRGELSKIAGSQTNFQMIYILIPTNYSRVNFKERPLDAGWDVSAYTHPNGGFVDIPELGKAFVPARLPPKIPYDNEMIDLLARAESAVGELRGRGRGIPNPHILIRPYLKREAVMSSRIEGTMASLEDLNMQEALGNISREDSENLRLIEVQNYVRALEASLGDLRSGECRIELQLILKAHEILMRGVRGGDRSPGKLRERQNAIVSVMGMRRAIAHVPPPPAMVRDLLDDLWAFVGDDNGMSALVKCAVAHYQFEAIHPFSDGNGRVGRLLIPLMLHAAGVMEQPLLYVSAYFEYRKQEYYEGLRLVSQSGGWQEWIKFFLAAFAVQADDAAKTLDNLYSLRADYASRLRRRNAKASALMLVDELLGNPYVTVPRAASLLGISYAGASSAVRALEAAGILEKTEIKARAKVFFAIDVERTLT